MLTDHSYRYSGISEQKSELYIHQATKRKRTQTSTSIEMDFLAFSEELTIVLKMDIRSLFVHLENE